MRTYTENLSILLLHLYQIKPKN